MMQIPTEIWDKLDKYIGIPFEEMNCWEFICHFYRRELDIELPTYDGQYQHCTDHAAIVRLYEREAAALYWPKVDEPHYPDLAVFFVERRYFHAGIVIAPQVMLHSQINIDSCIESYKTLRWRNRFIGHYRYHPQN